MSEGLTCPQGHWWASAGGAAGAALSNVCPVCGASAVNPTETAVAETLSLPPAASGGGAEAPGTAGYAVLSVVSHDASGTVVIYKARNRLLSRPVVLKVIRVRDGSQRWGLAEAEALGRLHHPNIQHLYEAREQDGCLVLTLEDVEGVTLFQKMAGKPHPARPAAALAETLARAVHHAHRRG